MNDLNKINDLKKSPLFNLSLSSKELFHSNFIAWICEIYSSDFGNILSEKFRIGDRDNIIISTRRELKNLDLIIEFKTTKLIIENKVKSVPNKQQLIEYRLKSNPNEIYVLLSLIKPNFDLNEIGWRLLTYKDLSNLLSKLVNKISNEYHKEMVSDYVNFINILSDLMLTIKLDFNDGFFDFYGYKHKLFYSVRLHDLYLKNSYNELILELQKYLSSKISGYKIISGERYSHQVNRNQIVISTTIVNGKGVVNIDYSNEDEIIFGIMLDGNRYNQYIYAWGSKAVSIVQTADELKHSDKWFKFENINVNDIYPKREKKYNRYGNNMLYRSIKINGDKKLSSLFEQIYSDLKKII